MTSLAARRKMLALLTEGCVLRLYRNDATPEEGSDLADFVELPVVGGYAPFVVTPEAWQVSEDGLKAGVEHTWDLHGVRVDVYGWVLEWGGVLLQGKRFPALLRVTGAGGRVEVECSVEV